MMLKCYLFVIFCVIQVRADNVFEELRNKTHEITLEYNQEYEKRKLKDPNIDYLRELHAKLIRVLSNNNYEEPKCDKGDLQKQVEILQTKVDAQEKEIKTLNCKIDETNGPSGNSLDPNKIPCDLL